ncbi:MAG: response regulator [Nitrospirota bacterium]|nr:MAG: response regulator [Nitrospirota bacterium]
MANESLIEFFIAEAEDHINLLEKGILNLESNPSDRSMIEDMFRSAHTLKGSAALVKLGQISKIAHLMEDIFEEIKDGKKKTTSGLATWMFRGLDAIKRLIKSVRAGKGEDPSAFEKFNSALNQIHETAKPVSGPAPLETASILEAEMVEEEPTVSAEDILEAEVIEEEPVAAGPAKTVEEKRGVGRRKDDVEVMESKFVRIDIDNVEQLMNLMGELTIIKNYLVQQVSQVHTFRDEINFAGRRLISEVTSFSEKYEYSGLEKADDKVSYVDPLLSEFHELEFDKYDELNLFSRKLHEITDDINEAMKSLSSFFDALSSKVNSMDRLISNSKELISEARMVTIGKLYQRFTRAVRDIALQNNKKIKFMTAGFETKIDKIIFERIFDSILHILRNAIAHGIETPNERTLNGKSPEGTIHLDTRREGNAIVIEIKDDGKGIDFDRIRTVALEKQIIMPNEDLTEEDLLHILFRSGFSTAASADMTSGRGVGLDVVKETLSLINGSIEIMTEKNEGTTFRLKVPLSLIIINVVIFSSGGMEFILPSTLVQELSQIDVDVLEDAETFTLREMTMPITRLNNLLGLRDAGATKQKPVIILNISGKHFAMVVDGLVGQEDTIIKPFGKFLEGIKQFAGVSISADGKIRPVINPAALIDVTAISLESGEVTEKEPVSEQETILVVDDSLSVRKFASMILEGKDYKVLSATNGLEALNIIDDNRVDLIISDLEMPVMHGYELLSELKRRGLLEIMPVVVLTSRSSESHKNKAFQLGASDFLIKPFDETTLYEAAKKNIAPHHLT